jgi:lysophospholipase L1-like esterase
VDRRSVTERRRTPEDVAATRRKLRARYRRRRGAVLVVAVAGLVGVGAFLAGFGFGGTSAPTPPRAVSTIVCESTEPAEIVRPRWLTARRRLVLVDSVLLGGTVALRERFRHRRLKIIGEPAIMLPAMEERMARRRSVTKLVIVGIGYNSLWERRRKNFSLWARKFDTEARDLLATLRRKGARQFVWVTLRDARRRVIPRDALWQYDRYAWYFPYVNERLRRLDRKRDDLVLALWDKVSDRRGLTYDAIHLNPVGAALMADTIYEAIRAEGRRQTRVVPPPPSACG